MVYLRSVLFYLGMTVITLLHNALIPFTYLVPISHHQRYAYLVLWSRVVMVWLRLCCGLTYRVIGTENIPAGPAIILAKHQSAWETIALQQIFPPQTWVLKRELFYIPFFGWALRATKPVAINRGSTKEALRQVLQQGKQRLDEGLWMVIFPEGTRTLPGTRGRYAVGGALLAERSRYPVVPVAHNAGEFWKASGFLKYPGEITVVIGPVIDSTQFKAGEINHQVEQWIEATMDRITTLKPD
ncbi:MAG TPA: lysophospholipid acyltransferase family protein [Gammaproteobacteria bacterium]